MACQEVWNRCSTSWARQTVGETGVSSNTWLDYITRCCCDAINVVRHEHFQLFFSERQGKGWLTRLHVDFEDTTCTHQHIMLESLKFVVWFLRFSRNIQIHTKAMDSISSWTVLFISYLTVDNFYFETSVFTFKYIMPYINTPSEKVEALHKARGAESASDIEVKQLQSTTWIWT